MAGDAYIRIDPTGVRIFGEAVHDYSLVFVDVNDGELGLLRHADPSLIQRAKFVLLRTNGNAKRARRELARIVTALSPRAHCGILEQGVGTEAAIVPTDPDADDWVRRARRVELRALLDWGRAVWEPAQYHFRLPSGEHASSFIRLSAAIRSPHDAHVLSTWLLAHVEPGVGLVVDTGTLTPIATALQALLGRSDPRIQLGRVVVLQEYPHTQLAVNDAVAHVAENGTVLALLSVNSSGEFRERILTALRTNESLRRIQRWNLHVMVDRQSEWPQSSARGMHTWFSLGGVVSGHGDRPKHALHCELCQSEKRAAVVQIDPSSYEGSVAARTRLVMPSTEDSRENRSFWELCEAAQAAIVHAEPDSSAQIYRAPGRRLGIKIDFDRLLAVPEFSSTVASRIGLVFNDQEDRDLVLVPQHDHRRPGFSEFWEQVGPLLGASAAVVAFPLDRSWSDDIVATVRGASRLCILSFGTVTGASLQAAYLAVQEARKGVQGTYDVHGVVVHARPTDDRRLKNLRNVFGPKYFHCLWDCRIPERSPIEAELEILNRVAPDRLKRRAREFYALRRQLCGGQASFDGNAILWGGLVGDHLTPHSMFGEKMHAPTTLLAVGAAIHRRRLAAIDDYPAPDRIAFELPAIAYSYFDPLIFSSMLRWMDPAELSWGERDDGAGGVIRGLVQRAQDPEQRCILVAELLLAFAQGKLRQDAKSTLLEVAERALQSAPDERAGALELGIALAEQVGFIRDDATPGSSACSGSLARGEACLG